jgi:oxygen-independent coproporphyrinogen-3 oxidase
MARGKSGKKLNLGLYLHIPFCQAICSYCNFNRGLLDEGVKARYVDALEQEIHRSATGEAADTIFFGGGTPSLLDPEDVARLIGACGAAFTLSSAPEITLETNPETATPSHLAALRAAGVNRISFGVQSFDDDELARLGRIHSAARARDAVRDARRAGFTQLSFVLAPGAVSRLVASHGGGGHRARTGSPVPLLARAVSERAAPGGDGSGGRRRRRLGRLGAGA